MKAAFYSIIPAMLLTACHSWSGDVGEPLQQVVKVESESPQRQRKNVVHDPVAAARQIDGYHAYLMAELLSEKGAYRQALVQLEYAYSLEENSFLATKLLALLLVLQDEVEIDKWADRLVLRHPESASLHFLYGNILLEKKLFALAIAEFNASLEDPSVNELAYIQLISAHEALGNSALAMKLAESMRRKFPQSASALLKLSYLYLQRDNRKQAFNYLSKAYALEPEQEEIALRYAVALSLENKRSKALEIYSHFLGHTFDLEELNSKIEKLVQINGANLPYYEQQFQQLLPLSKGEHTVGLHLLRCFLFIALGQGEKVQEDIVALEAAKASYPALPFMLGVAYERLGKQEHALEHYRAIHEDEKHYLWANQRMVQLLQQSGKMDAALALALNLINYKFADWEAYLLAATVYGAMERYAEGIELLEQGVRRYPHKVRILFMQGALQEKSGQISPCIATIERVVKLDPFNHTAYNFLGYLYAERGENLDQAEKLITTALDLKPGDGFYLDSLGMVNFQKGKYAEALSLYLRALAQVPEEGVILEHVGDVYSKQNEQEQAVNYWKKALEKKIEEKDRLRIQKKLGS